METIRGIYLPLVGIAVVVFLVFPLWAIGTVFRVIGKSFHWLAEWIDDRAERWMRQD